MSAPPEYSHPADEPSATRLAEQCGPFGGRGGSMWARRLVFVFAVLLLAAGCEATSAGEAGSPDSSGGFPVVVEDDLGREVEVPARPEAIGSMAPSVTEAIFAVGAERRLAGVTTTDDYPREVEDYPVIGGYREPNFERVAEMGIDLLFVSSEAATEDEAEEIKRLGRATVIVVNPETVDEAISSIGLIGKSVGEAENARRLQNDLRAELDEIGDAVADEPKPTVFYEVWPDPLRTVGPGSFIHDAIRVAGGENIAADTGEAYPSYSEEILVEAGPDYYLAGRGTSGEVPGAYERLAGVAGTKFVRVDEDLVSRPGPRVVEGVREISEAIHPEAFDGEGGT
ncbi:MAG: ABC transporter substrate-binding protein [Actinomycetota bacterium]|nr:ABC transporter substrate-binding protein [Rubrobacter sp.]MDQ3506789.1 ABC transporter substrate-binding protein [Actinomycetota bacterium]